MSKAHPPELKKYMDKSLSLRLNGSRVVSGILRGFDPFMNIVLGEIDCEIVHCFHLEIQESIRGAYWGRRQFAVMRSL